MHAQRGRWLAPGLVTLMAGCVCAVFASGALATTGSVRAGAAAESSPAKHRKSKPRFVDPLATSAMRAYIGSRTGDIAIGVENLLTDRTYLWNGRSQWNEEGGAPAVAAYNRLVGMDQTTPNLDWGLTTTSVGDQLKLLDELVEPHALIDQGAQRFALGLMEHVTRSQAWGVSGGVPSGVRVALKNGWLPFGGGWHINSIGRIRGDGRWYLIAVVTSFNPSERYGIDTINAISSRVWHALTPPARGPDPGKRIVAAARDQTARASAAEAMQARHPSS